MNIKQIKAYNKIVKTWCCIFITRCLLDIQYYYWSQNIKTII